MVVVVCFCFQQTMIQKARKKDSVFPQKCLISMFSVLSIWALQQLRAKPFQCPDVLEFKQASQSFIPTVNIYQGLLVWAFPVAQLVKNLLAVQETRARSLGWEDLLEKEMATHSSIRAWRIPWTQEPGGLQSMGRKSWT